MPPIQRARRPIHAGIGFALGAAALFGAGTCCALHSASAKNAYLCPTFFLARDASERAAIARSL